MTPTIAGTTARHSAPPLTGCLPPAPRRTRMAWEDIKLHVICHSKRLGRYQMTCHILPKWPGKISNYMSHVTQMAWEDIILNVTCQPNGLGRYHIICHMSLK